MESDYFMAEGRLVVSEDTSSVDTEINKTSD